MKISEAAKFATGALLFTPLFAAEDVLRHFGAPISKHGATKNDNNEGILDIWRAAGKEVAKRQLELKAIKEFEAEARKLANKVGKKIADDIFSDNAHIGLVIDGETIL